MCVSVERDSVGPRGYRVTTKSCVVAPKVAANKTRAKLNLANLLARIFVDDFINGRLMHGPSLLLLRTNGMPPPFCAIPISDPPGTECASFGITRREFFKLLILLTLRVSGRFATN